MVLTPATESETDRDEDRDILATMPHLIECVNVQQGPATHALVRAHLERYWDGLEGALRRLNLFRAAIVRHEIDVGEAARCWVSQLDSDLAPMPSALALRAGRALVRLAELECLPPRIQLVAGVAGRINSASRIYAPWRFRQREERERPDGSGFAASTAQVAADCLEQALMMRDAWPEFGRLHAEAGIALAAELLYSTDLHHRASVNAGLHDRLEALADADGVQPDVGRALRSLAHQRMDVAGVHGLLDQLASEEPAGATRPRVGVRSGPAPVGERAVRSDPIAAPVLAAPVDSLRSRAEVDPLMLDLTSDGKALRLGDHRLTFKKGTEIRRVTVSGPEGKFLLAMAAGISPLPHASRNERSHVRKALKSAPGHRVRLIDPDANHGDFRLIEAPTLSASLKRMMGLM